jgi:hypothetical protein
VFGLVWLVAIVLHEMTHYVILRRGGARPVSILRHPSRVPNALIVKSLGLGWVYDPRNVLRETRMRSYVYANLVDVCVWVVAAILLPDLRLPLLVGGEVMLLFDWYTPKADGWNYRRLKREAAELRSESEENRNCA